MSRSTAAASQTSGLLVVARARQLAFVDLATAVAASAAQPAGRVLVLSLLRIVLHAKIRTAL